MWLSGLFGALLLAAREYQHADDQHDHHEHGQRGEIDVGHTSRRFCVVVRVLSEIMTTAVSRSTTPFQ